MRAPLREVLNRFVNLPFESIHPNTGFPRMADVRIKSFMASLAELRASSKQSILMVFPDVQPWEFPYSKSRAVGCTIHRWAVWIRVEDGEVPYPQKGERNFLRES